jgi:hypothetical protein
LNSTKTPRRLVMHVGPHKTATSYLQYNFHHNRAELAKRGWLYPETGERVRTAHHDISDQRNFIFKDKSKMAQELLRIGERAKAEGLNILLSSEGFQHCKPRVFTRIKELLQMPELEIAYAIRDPLDHFYATWAQKVKNGSVEALPDLAARHFAEPLKSHLLNPMVELEPVARDCAAAIKLLHYDQIVAQKLDIYKVFATQVLGLDDIEPAASSPRNQRMPIELTEFLRTLTPMTGIEREREAIKVGTAFQYFVPRRLKQAIEKAMAADAPEARQELIVNRAERGLIPIETQILARFGASIYPAPPSPERLFNKDQAVWVHYDSEALRRNPAIKRLLEQVLRRVGAKSLYVRGANAVYAGLIALRRWRKGFSR